MLESNVKERLRNLGGDALVRRMVRLFLVTSAEARQRINTGLSNDLLAPAQAAAHHLFASAAQLRLRELADAAERVEDAARSGDLAGARAAAQHLSGVVDVATEDLRGLLKELPDAPCVVVVDDSEDMRVLLRLILEPQYDVTDYSDATTALVGIRRLPPDVLIIDVSLPDMSGVELLRLIRAEAALRNIPAIAVTALNAPQDSAASFVESGFDLHVRKPIVDPDDLLRKLDKLVKNREWN